MRDRSRKTRKMHNKHAERHVKGTTVMLNPPTFGRNTKRSISEDVFEVLGEIRNMITVN